MTNAEQNAKAQMVLDRIVGSVWALCKRPGMYTARSTLEEIVAYMFGMLHEAPPREGRAWPDYDHGFARFLRDRHDIAEQDVVAPARLIVMVLRRAYTADDQVAALWTEFEQYAAEHLGVAAGTYPIQTTRCGYGSHGPAV